MFFDTKKKKKKNNNKKTLGTASFYEKMSKLFFEIWRFVLTGLFRCQRGKWISDVTGTNTVFDVEAGNRKLALFFGEDFGGSRPLHR